MEKLRADFDRFAADAKAHERYDSNCEVNSEILFPKNADTLSDGK